LQPHPRRKVLHELTRVRPTLEYRIPLFECIQFLLRGSVVFLEGILKSIAADHLEEVLLRLAFPLLRIAVDDDPDGESRAPLNAAQYGGFQAKAKEQLPLRFRA
jgi:hypothetical protein